MEEQYTDQTSYNPTQHNYQAPPNQGYPNTATQPSLFYHNPPQTYNPGIQATQSPPQNLLFSSTQPNWSLFPTQQNQALFPQHHQTLSPVSQPVSLFSQQNTPTTAQLFGNVTISANQGTIHDPEIADNQDYEPEDGQNEESDGDYESSVSEDPEDPNYDPLADLQGYLKVRDQL